MQLPLSSMTVAEKLDAMEQLWNSLQNDPVSESSPAWHEEILNERRQQMECGETVFSSFAEVADRLRKRKS